MKAILVSGGTKPSRNLFLEYYTPGDRLIAADSGAEFLREIGIIPDLILGDFDSVSDDTLVFFQGKCEILKFNPVKDFTDTEAAFHKAQELHPDAYILFGCTGNRLDHLLGNLSFLEAALDEGKEAFIVDDHNKIYLVDRPVSIRKDFGDFISFQGFRGDVTDFTITGARYGLSGYTLRMGDPRTVSNQFEDEEIRVSFTSGKVLVIKSRD